MENKIYLCTAAGGNFPKVWFNITAAWEVGSHEFSSKNRFLFYRTILTFGSLHNLTFTRLVRIDEYAKFLNIIKMLTYTCQKIFTSHIIHSIIYHSNYYLDEVMVEKSRHNIRLKSKNANFE